VYADFYGASMLHNFAINRDKVREEGDRAEENAKGRERERLEGPREHRVVREAIDFSVGLRKCKPILVLRKAFRLYVSE